jgi:hypothetical protein
VQDYVRALSNLLPSSAAQPGSAAEEQIQRLASEAVRSVLIAYIPRAIIPSPVSPRGPEDQTLLLFLRAGTVSCYVAVVEQPKGVGCCACRSP